MKIKKLLPLLLSFSLLAGCGNGANTTDSEIVTELKEPVEITFWHAMNGAQEEALTELTEDFMASNSNVKVNLQNQSSYKDLQQKVTATLASPKNLPTMTQAYGNWMYQPIEDGMILDLKPYMENETLKFDNYDDIIEGLKDGLEVDGKIYGLPFNKSSEVIWYNKTLFDELGLTVPTTYEEFAETAKVIYEKKGIPGAGFDSLNNFYTIFLRNEGKVFDKNFNVTSEASVKAANYYLDGIKEGYFRIAGTDKFLSGPFGNEQLGMYVGSNAGESYVVKGSEGKFEPGIAPYPAKAAMQQGTDLYVFSNATPEQKTAAYEYMKFLTNKDNQIKWAIATGYMPIRESALQSEEYKNCGSLFSTVVEGVSSKDLFINPISSGSQAAYNDAATVMEDILSDKNSDVNAKLAEYQKTLESTWE